MTTERRGTLRLNVTPDKVKASLTIGKQRFTGRMLNESINGFALTLDLPNRQFKDGQFKQDEDCALFGELAVLKIQKMGYEIQIVSVTAFEEEDGPRLATNHKRVRFGVRIIREIPASQMGGVFTYKTAMIATGLLVVLGLAAGAYTYQDQLAELAQSDAEDTEPFWESWKREVSNLLASSEQPLVVNQDGLLVPGSTAMLNLMKPLGEQPMRVRIQRISLLQDKKALKWLELSPAEAAAVRQMAMETETDLERIWSQFQTEKEMLEQKIGEYLTATEEQLMAHMTQSQAEKWVQFSF